MNATNKTASELRRLQEQGARYLLVCRYSVGRWDKGDVLSWHRTHDAAVRADAKADPARCHMHVVDITDAIADALYAAPGTTYTVKTDAVIRSIKAASADEACKLFADAEGFDASTQDELSDAIEGDGGWLVVTPADGGPVYTSPSAP